MFVQRPTIRTHHHNHNHQHISSTVIHKTPAIGSLDRRVRCSALDRPTTSRGTHNRKQVETPEIIATNEKVASSSSGKSSKLVRQTKSNIETHTFNRSSGNITNVPCKASSTPNSFRSHVDGKLIRKFVPPGRKVSRLNRSRSLITFQSKPRIITSSSCDCILLALLRNRSETRRLAKQEQERSSKILNGNKRFSNEFKKSISAIRRGNSFDTVLENVSQLETWRLLAEDDQQKDLLYQIHFSNNPAIKNLTGEIGYEIAEGSKQVLENLLYNQMNNFSSSIENTQPKMFDQYNSSNYHRYYHDANQPFQLRVSSQARDLPSSTFSSAATSHSTTKQHLINSTSALPRQQTTISHHLSGLPGLSPDKASSFYQPMAAGARYVNRTNAPFLQNYPSSVSAFKKHTNNANQQISSVQMSIDSQYSNIDNLYCGKEEPRSLSLNDSEDSRKLLNQHHRANLQARLHSQQSVDGLINSYSRNRASPNSRPISSIGQHKPKPERVHYHNVETTTRKTLKVGSDSELYSSNNYLSGSSNHAHLERSNYTARLHNQMSLDYSSRVHGHSDSPSVSAKSVNSYSSRLQNLQSNSIKKNNTIKLSLSGAKKRLGFKQNGLNALSVQRSEEVIPFDTNLSFSDSFIENSFINQLQNPCDSLSNSFIEGLGPGQVASRQALVSPYLGDVQLTLSDRRGMLEVEVVRARRLQSKVDAKNLPSPYVKVYLVKNKKCIAKFKTAQARQTLDPLYQQLFIFRENYAHCVVQVIIWGDYGKKDRKSLMGIVQINIDELDISNLVIGWYRLLNAPSMVNSLNSSKALRQMMLSKQT